MKFDFYRYKSLLAYDFATTKKSMALCYAIALLVFAALCALTYQFNKHDWDVVPFNSFLDASKFLAVAFHFSMIFWCTKMLLRHKYSKPNNGIGYTMLPASTLEKGLTILTEYFVYAIIGTILLYVVAYSGVWVAMDWIIKDTPDIPYTVEMPYAPFDFLSDLYHGLYDEPLVVHSAEEEMALRTFLYFVFMLPVTVFLHFMLYLVFNLMFKNNGQLKSLGLLAAIDSAFNTGIIFYASVIVQEYAERHSHDMIDQPDMTGWLIYPSIALITMQIPAAVALVWYFFRRLRTKEIR